MNSHPPQAKKRRGEDKDVNNLRKSVKLGEFEDPVNSLSNEKVKKSILSGCDELLDLIRKSFLQKKRDFLNLELAYEESEDRLQQPSLGQGAPHEDQRPCPHSPVSRPSSWGR